MVRLILESDCNDCCKKLQQLDISGDASIYELKCCVSNIVNIPVELLEIADEGGSRYLNQNEFLTLKIE